MTQGETQSRVDLYKDAFITGVHWALHYLDSLEGVTLSLQHHAAVANGAIVAAAEVSAGDEPTTKPEEEPVAVDVVPESAELSPTSEPATEPVTTDVAPASEIKTEAEAAPSEAPEADAATA